MKTTKMYVFIYKHNTKVTVCHEKHF